MTSTEAEPDPPGDRRRRVGFALLGAAIAIIAVVLLVTSPWSSGEDDDPAPSTESSTPDPTPGTDDARSSVPPPTGPVDPDQTPAGQVPVATIDVGGPGGPCAAVVARLQTYSAAARQSEISDLQLLFEKLSQFEDEIFQVAQGQAWGDELVEQIVVVRRGWVDAGSAQSEGDEVAARQRADEANALLDSAIAAAPC